MLKLATKFIPEPTAFETAYAVGFRHAEFWSDEALLNRWFEVVQMAGSYPLDYALHFPNRGDLNEGTLNDAISLYNGLGCSAMVIHRPQFRRYGEYLQAIDSSVRLGVENHRVEEDQVDEWANDSRWLTLDVEHFWKFTIKDAPLEYLMTSLRTFLTKYSHKLAHVHMPGYAPGAEEHRPQYCSREMVFQVFDLLEEFQYDGFVVSETDSEYQNSEELRMDVLMYDYWRTKDAPWRPERFVAVPASERERTLA